MKHSFADQFAGLDSWLNRLSAEYKILCCLISVILIALTPIELESAFIVYAALLSFLIFTSGIPLLFFVKRLIAVLPFVIIVALSVPFIQRDGWVIFISCIIKAALIILSLNLLIQTTRFSRLLSALGRLGVPGVIIMLLSFMYRYLFVVEDEILRKRRALKSRSAQAKGLRMMKSTANMAGSLFIQTYERAERVYLAMCARGYKPGQDPSSGA